MKPVLAIPLAVALLAGCGSDGGDSGRTPTPTRTATPNTCCTPGLPCTFPNAEGTPIAATCSYPRTPTPGGTPPSSTITCFCIGAGDELDVHNNPSPGPLCYTINNTPNAGCRTRTPLPD
ncbi:MAG: hypothetical protein ABI629_15380 [bacterium]